MSDLHLIESTLAQTARRRRLERGFRRMWEGLFWGAAAWLLFLVAYKLLPMPTEYLTYSWLILPLSALLGFVWGRSAWRIRRLKSHAPFAKVEYALPGDMYRNGGVRLD